MHPLVLEKHSPLSRVLSGGGAMTTSYKTIDAVIATMRPQAARMALEGHLGPKGFKHDAGRRDEVELLLAWTRWDMSGRFTFSIGPETTARIVRRVDAGDVPTEPVAPAYLQFDAAPTIHGDGRPLRGAYISRGEVGTITFVTMVDSGRMTNTTTVLLPSVMTVQQLEGLRHTRRAEMPRHENPGRDDAVEELTRRMTAGHPMGGNIGFDAAAFLRASLTNMGAIAHGEQGAVGVAAIAQQHDAISGCTLPEKGSEHLPRAAAIVLVAADEARRADPAYAAPRYLNSDAISRGWMEDGETIAYRADAGHIVRMP